MRGRRGVQVGRGDPERRPLRLGFTEGRAVRGREGGPGGQQDGSGGPGGTSGFSSQAWSAPAPRRPPWGSGPGLWWLCLFQ